jgi:hypothetical protein
MARDLLTAAQTSYPLPQKVSETLREATFMWRRVTVREEGLPTVHR